MKSCNMVLFHNKTPARPDPRALFLAQLVNNLCSDAAKRTGAAQKTKEDEKSGCNGAVYLPVLKSMISEVNSLPLAEPRYMPHVRTSLWPPIHGQGGDCK